MFNKKIKSFIRRKILNKPLDKWDYFYASNRGENNNSATLIRNNVISTYIQHLKPNAKILDVGCGSGKLLNSINHLNYDSYLGIDISSIAINLAQENEISKRNNTQFEVADMMEFSTRTQYDIIIFNETIYYTPSADIILKIYRMFLDSNGIFIVSLIQNEYTFDIYKQIIGSGFRIIDETVVQNSKNKHCVIVISGS
ncbi:class I SAM-dependent methyltransferase [Emticicia sp. SJ17W-69]|uniref:class I SAM-dependent methyltransferase n=1 Tax=Emticicia sp. SJ17W-69 TaxID=3421657 RepID=UPI003EBCF29F